MTDDAGIGRLLRVAFPTPPDDECIAATLARLSLVMPPVDAPEAVAEPRDAADDAKPEKHVHNIRHARCLPHSASPINDDGAA